MSERISGAWGEEKAAEYLINNGYSIIERNYNCRISEIDIIAKKGNTLVFAEVKTRRSKIYAEAREFVGKTKQDKLRKAAGLWLSSNSTGLQPRFDVIEVYAPDGENTVSPRINHIINAFY